MDEPTIDAVRKELRTAIFFSALKLGALGDPEQEKIMQQGACAFIEFGVRSKLLPVPEGNEWLDAVWGRKTLADVAQKYNPE